MVGAVMLYAANVTILEWVMPKWEDKADELSLRLSTTEIDLLNCSHWVQDHFALSCKLLTGFAMLHALAFWLKSRYIRIGAWLILFFVFLFTAWICFTLAKSMAA